MSSVPLRSQVVAAGVPGSWSHWQCWTYYACTALQLDPGPLNAFVVEHPPLEDSAANPVVAISDIRPGPVRGTSSTQGQRACSVSALGRPNPRWIATGAQSKSRLPSPPPSPHQTKPKPHKRISFPRRGDRPVALGWGSRSQRLPPLPSQPRKEPAASTYLSPHQSKWTARLGAGSPHPPLSDPNPAKSRESARWADNRPGRRESPHRPAEG